MIEKFDLGSLSTIDQGRIREAFEQALERCRLDCEDRPNVAKARKVTLSATLTPVSGQSGGMDSCNVQFEINDTLPKRATGIYNMHAGRGGLLFNELSKEDIRQRTLDEAPAPRATETETLEPEEDIENAS